MGWHRYPDAGDRRRQSAPDQRVGPGHLAGLGRHRYGGLPLHPASAFNHRRHGSEDAMSGAPVPVSLTARILRSLCVILALLLAAASTSRAAVLRLTNNALY